MLYDKFEGARPTGMLLYQRLAIFTATDFLLENTTESQMPSFAQKIHFQNCKVVLPIDHRQKAWVLKHNPSAATDFHC